MIHANRIVPRFLLSAILAMIMTFFLQSVLGAVADTATSVSPVVGANDQPPFTADQISKIQKLINGSGGHDGHMADTVATALGLGEISGTLRSFGVDAGKKGQYEISILPNNSGYVIVHQVTDSARIIRLDSNFAFVSAITRTCGNIPAAMPIPDANRFYSEDIATWRKIIDKLGSP